MDVSPSAIGRRSVMAHAQAAANLRLVEIPQSGFRVLQVFVRDIRPGFENGTPAYALIRKGGRRRPDILYRADREQDSLTSWVTLDPDGELLPVENGYATARTLDYAVYDPLYAAKVETAIQSAGLPQLRLDTDRGREMVS